MHSITQSAINQLFFLLRRAVFGEVPESKVAYKSYVDSHGRRRMETREKVKEREWER
jgi:hypothetical protein